MCCSKYKDHCSFFSRSIWSIVSWEISPRCFFFLSVKKYNWLFFSQFPNILPKEEYARWNWFQEDHIASSRARCIFIGWSLVKQKRMCVEQSCLFLSVTSNIRLQSIQSLLGLCQQNKRKRETEFNTLMEGNSSMPVAGFPTRLFSPSTFTWY